MEGDAATLAERLTLVEMEAEIEGLDTGVKLGLGATEGVSAVLAPKLRDTVAVMEGDAATLADRLTLAEMDDEELTVAVMLALAATEGVSAVLAP